MSRVGKQPITIPAGVEVSVKGNVITAKGTKGTLDTPLFKGVTVSVEGNVLTFVCEDLSNKIVKSNFGLARALAANVITGVTTGFQKTLELRGVGYRAQTQGKVLNLSLGFSHPINYELPAGVEASVEKSNIIISGIDKQQVGQVAAEIRAYRPPEPYKGKGVRYVGEHVAMKEGKRA